METTHQMPSLMVDLAAMIRSAPADGEQSAITDPAEYVREAKRRSAIERYRNTCPPAHQETNFSHPDLAPYRTQIDKVLAWKFNPRGLIASGQTGCGKTRAMWELYRRITCEDVIDARFWPAAEWFSTLQQYVQYGRDDAQGWIEAVADRRVVFIDDFGQEAILANKSDWAAGWFFRFLDIRVGKKLPVIISTNLHATQFSGDLRGDPMIRRIKEVCETVRF